jgi:DNA-binding transcriptional ArsR family regulator
MAKKKPKQFRPELIGRVVERLKALADENRIRLLMRLKEGECNVSTLSEELGLSQASTSKHLSVLRQVGLIDVTRQGTQAIYRIHDESVFEMCEIVCDGVIRHIEEQQEIIRHKGEGI